MDMREVIRSYPIVAILRNVPLEQTLDYVGAAYRAGIRGIEVALNSPEGLKQIALIREKGPQDLYVGAGTAITRRLAEEAVQVGARFLLTPSVSTEVLAYCSEQGIALLPGVMTPTDVATCLSYGFSTLKLFPAGDLPANYIKSLQGPFDSTEYVAVGGVGPQNIADFFARGFLGVGIGSNLFPKELVHAGNWDAAAEAAAALVSAAR